MPKACGRVLCKAQYYQLQRLAYREFPHPCYPSSQLPNQSFPAQRSSPYQQIHYRQVVSLSRCYRHRHGNQRTDRTRLEMCAKDCPKTLNRTTFLGTLSNSGRRLLSYHGSGKELCRIAESTTFRAAVRRGDGSYLGNCACPITKRGLHDLKDFEQEHVYRHGYVLREFIFHSLFPDCSVY